LDKFDKKTVGKDNKLKVSFYRIKINKVNKTTHLEHIDTVV